MRLTIELAKLSEVEQLLLILREMDLQNIKVVVDDNNYPNTNNHDVLSSIHRPMRKRLDLNQLKEEKKYKGLNRDHFNKLVKEIDIEEPIELLLSQLSR